MKIKARLRIPLVVGFKVCKKSDITIIISMNENIQISTKKGTKLSMKKGDEIILHNLTFIQALQIFVFKKRIV